MVGRLAIVSHWPAVGRCRAPPWLARLASATGSAVFDRFKDAPGDPAGHPADTRWRRRRRPVHAARTVRTSPVRASRPGSSSSDATTVSRHGSCSTSASTLPAPARRSAPGSDSMLSPARAEAASTALRVSGPSSGRTDEREWQPQSWSTDGGCDWPSAASSRGALPARPDPQVRTVRAAWVASAPTLRRSCGRERSPGPTGGDRWAACRQRCACGDAEPLDPEGSRITCFSARAGGCAATPRVCPPA